MRSVAFSAPLALAVLVFGVLSSHAGSASADQDSDLARARVALKNLGYTDARALLDSALKRGEHPRAELLEIYALRGEVEAVLDGAEASEIEFRKLLLLDPQHAPPARDTPTFRAPFDRAKAWVANAGRLHIEQKTVATSSTSFDLIEQILSDPLAMATAVQVRYRANDIDQYAKLSTSAWRQIIPVAPGDARYIVDIVDQWGNTLVSFGTPDEPLRVSTALEPVAEVHARPLQSSSSSSSSSASVSDRWYATRAGWALFGVGIATGVAGGILLGEAGVAAKDARNSPTRSGYLDERSRRNTFEGVGGALLGVGAGLFIAGTAVLIYRGTHH